jgi:hypothetical protein
MIMMKWSTYIETFPTRSWLWLSEEHIWKPFIRDHDHDLMHDLERKVSIYALHYIMIMILMERFPNMFFIESWSWSWRKCFHIFKIIIMIQWRTYMETFPSSPWSWFNEKRLWKLFFQDHDHDSMKNIFGNLSIKIMIMMKWSTYIETFPTRSWLWLSEEHIWKPFIQDHDHDLMKNIFGSLERFLYRCFISSWSWSWWKGFQICSSLNHDHELERKVYIIVFYVQDHDDDLMKHVYRNLSYKIMIMIQWRTYMEIFPSRSWFPYTFFIKSWKWSWRNSFHIRSSLNHDHDLDGKVSKYVLHWILIMILKEKLPNIFFINMM